MSSDQVWLKTALTSTTQQMNSTLESESQVYRMEASKETSR